jgi:hypothetical protein
VSNGGITERVNMFKVHYMHVWKYHSETPCAINCTQIKILTKEDGKDKVSLEKGSSSLLFLSSLASRYVKR